MPPRYELSKRGQYTVHPTHIEYRRHQPAGVQVIQVWYPQSDDPRIMSFHEPLGDPRSPEPLSLYSTEIEDYLLHANRVSSERNTQ